jgi:class 3 adenylate cyclase
MVAFEAPEKALQWCIAVQEDLLKIEWPSKLLENEDSKEERNSFGNMLYKGLRVRMGVHYGEPTCKIDPVTGRMDYFGKMVNRASRVSGTGHGGQILVSGSCWEKMDTKKLNVTATELGSFRLKGLESDEKIFQIMPKSLAAR